MAASFEMLRDHFDLTIFDAPALVEQRTTRNFAMIAESIGLDAVYLVCDAHGAHRETLAATSTALQHARHSRRGFDRKLFCAIDGRRFRHDHGGAGLRRAEVAAMYTTYWQLHDRPFENATDAKFYYPSEVHQGALLKLRYAVESSRGAALLAGAAGVGKTLLVNSLKRQLDDSYTPFVHVVFPQMNASELLAYLAAEIERVAARQRRGAGR